MDVIGNHGLSGPDIERRERDEEREERNGEADAA
jgi:hypothetical protein